MAGDLLAVAHECFCGCHSSSLLQTCPALTFAPLTVLLSVFMKHVYITAALVHTTHVAIITRLHVVIGFGQGEVHWHSEAVCATFERVFAEGFGPGRFPPWPVTGFAEKRWKQGYSRRILCPSAHSLLHLLDPFKQNPYGNPYSEP